MEFKNITKTLRPLLLNKFYWETPLTIDKPPRLTWGDFEARELFPKVSLTNQEILWSLTYYNFSQAMPGLTLPLQNWLKEIQNISPNLFDWVGLYFDSRYSVQDLPEGLFLGPFIGEETEHIFISKDAGICGMALREKRTLNIKDVHAVPEHIACSLTTKSELVIPLYNNENEMVAELDIDSNTFDAFSQDIQNKVEAKAKEFSNLLETK